MEFARGRRDDGITIRSGHLSAGAAWRDSILRAREHEQQGNFDGVEVSTISFEPGAYIQWHSHGDGQILIINHGRGVMVTRAEEVTSLQPGDIAYAPPHEEHWHGAAPETYLSQINISMGATTWLEPVSEEEYRKAVQQSKDL